MGNQVAALLPPRWGRSTSIPSATKALLRKPACLASSLAKNWNSLPRSLFPSFFSRLEISLNNNRNSEGLTILITLPINKWKEKF